MSIGSNAFRNENKPTYQNVLKFLTYPNNECSRDEAKAKVAQFAKEHNCTVADLFNDYKEVLENEISERALQGYFDY